jgi:hypothetical protein
LQWKYYRKNHVCQPFDQCIHRAKEGARVLEARALSVSSMLYHVAKKYMNMQKLQGLYPIIDSDVISMDIEKSVHIINQSPVNIVQ